jgi:hypothetical protein
LIDRHGKASWLRRSLALVIGLVAVFASLGPVRATSIWTKNLYASGAFLYQDPYWQGCTAASTMIMLNTIAYRRTGGNGFLWKQTRIKNDSNRSNVRDLTSILAFERAHDTLSMLGAGSDAHGWRNALNYYGWGAAAMTNQANMVYQDRAFSTFDAALHDAVRDIARFDKPVGIVGWAGRHAQVMTGYVVEGEDPAISDAFIVRYIYLSDSLRADGYVNIKLSTAQLRSGNLHYRFQAYRESDSPYDDAYTAGWKRSAVLPTRGPSQWYRRWVIVAPVRLGLPTPIPTPTPTPTPLPSPSDPPSSEPAATSEPTPSSEPAGSPAPTSTSPDAVSSATAPPTAAPIDTSGPSAAPPSAPPDASPSDASAPSAASTPSAPA